jgi:hypothetical protein
LGFFIFDPANQCHVLTPIARWYMNDSVPTLERPVPSRPPSG